MAAYTQPAPVERKVKASTLGTYLAGVAALAVVNVFVGDASLISGLPDAVEVLVAPVIPALAALIAGYNAKHTPRPAE